MTPLRSFRIHRARREYQPPQGTTHVLDYVRDGYWELTPLGIWLAGEFRREYSVIPGPPSMTEEDFGRLAVEGPRGPVDLGEAGFLGGFEVPAGGPDAVPGFWLEVAP